MDEETPEFTKENSPTMYLCEILKEAIGFESINEPGFFMGSLASGALHYLCGEEPKAFADPSEYYERNQVKGDKEIVIEYKDGKKESISSTARLYPITGGFFIGLNPFRNQTENDKMRSKWHELAHTLFYKWEGENKVPEFQGRGWHPDGTGIADELEEEICDAIADKAFPKRYIFLGGKPAVHYELVKRLKQEDFDVRYTSDEAEFEGLLQKLWYMPELVSGEIIHYDMVIMDTRLITDAIVEHENTHTGPTDILREKIGEEPLVHFGRVDYFLNNYFQGRFEDGLAARDDPIIILADEEIADQIGEIVEQREQRKLIRLPYDVEEVLREVKLDLAALD